MEIFTHYIIPIISIIASFIIAYYTSFLVYRKQFEDGKVQVLEILKRYIINVSNNFDQNGIIKTSLLDRHFYLIELKSISDDIKVLVGNPILIKCFRKHTGLSKLTIMLRREIAFLEQPDSAPVIYKETLNSFLDLYFIIKKEFKKKWFEKDRNLREINELAEKLYTNFCC